MNSIIGTLDNNVKSTVEVQSISLDDYAKEKGLNEIDLVKIDVEGAEMMVIKGIKELLSNNKVKIIQFEYGPFSIYAKSFLKDFFEILQMHEFEMFKISPGKLLFYQEYNHVLDTFSHSNWLAVKKGYKFSAKISSYSIPGPLI